jgi:hypothetical protein
MLTIEELFGCIDPETSQYPTHHKVHRACTWSVLRFVGRLRRSQLQHMLGLSRNGTETHLKAEILSEKVFQKVAFSLVEMYQLVSRLFSRENLNSIASSTVHLLTGGSARLRLGSHIRVHPLVGGQHLEA